MNTATICNDGKCKPEVAQSFKGNNYFQDSGTTFYKGNGGTFLCKTNTPTIFNDGKCKPEVPQWFKRNNYFGDIGMSFYKEKGVHSFDKWTHRGVPATTAEYRYPRNQSLTHSLIIIIYNIYVFLLLPRHIGTHFLLADYNSFRIPAQCAN